MIDYLQLLQEKANNVARYYWTNTDSCLDENLVYCHQNREWHIVSILSAEKNNDTFQQLLKVEILKIAQKAFEEKVPLHIVAKQFSEPLLRITRRYVYQDTLAQFFGLVAKMVDGAGIYEKHNIKISRPIVNLIMSIIFKKRIEHIDRFHEKEINSEGVISSFWKIFPKNVDNICSQGVNLPHIYEHNAFYLKRLKHLAFKPKADLIFQFK